jgi:hypothetical protein
MRLLRNFEDPVIFQVKKAFNNRIISGDLTGYVTQWPCSRTEQVINYCAEGN